MGGGGEAGDQHQGWKYRQVLKRAKGHVSVLLMCYINTHLWMNQPISQPKDSEKRADLKKKKPEEAVRTPCCLLTLCNPLHCLLFFHRRCKDSIVLTVLQPHQVHIMRCSLAFMFLPHRISLTRPVFEHFPCYTEPFRVLLQHVWHNCMLLAEALNVTEP